MWCPLVQNVGMWVCGWVFTNFVIMSLKDNHVFASDAPQCSVGKNGDCVIIIQSLSWAVLCSWQSDEVIPKKHQRKKNACLIMAFLKLSTSRSFIVASSFNERRERTEIHSAKIRLNLQGQHLQPLDYQDKGHLRTPLKLLTCLCTHANREWLHVWVSNMSNYFTCCQSFLE